MAAEGNSQDDDRPQKPERRDAPSPRTVESQVSRMVEPITDPLVPLSTRITASRRKRLRMAALAKDTDVQTAVAEAIDMWLARNER